jgi:hypothetical protein
MSPTIRRMIMWSVLAGAASFVSLIAAGGVIVVGIFLEMCTRPHTLRWGALGFGLIAGYALMSVEWYDLELREAWWADALAGSIRVSGGIVAIAGVVGYIMLEKRFPPREREPTSPGRAAIFFERMEPRVLTFLSKNESFWSRVQAHPIGNVLLWIASLATMGVILSLWLGVKF